MLTRLEVHGYRTFYELTVEPLGRLNLVVGRNDVGKTAFVEAVDILVRSEDPRSLEAILADRGEILSLAGGSGVGEYDFSGLFHGRAPLPGGFSISGVMDGAAVNFRAPVRSQGHESGTGPGAHASSAGPPRVGRLIRIGPSRLSPQRLHELWDRVALTVEEDRVFAALRLIDADIEEATVLADPGEGTVRPFIKLRSHPERVPLATLGGGVGRLFELALAASTLDAGGILLVDEIDTGLHHRVLESMWRFVFEETRRRELQLIATTHSLDCLRGLASALDHVHDPSEGVCVHRLEKGRPASIKFEVDELRVAVQQEVEIR